MNTPTEETPSALHHALLNHIAVISSYVQLMRDWDLDEDQREFLSELAASADQAHALATELGERLDLHTMPRNAPKDPEEGPS